MINETTQKIIALNKKLTLGNWLYQRACVVFGELARIQRQRSLLHLLFFLQLMSSNAIKSTGQVCDFLAKSKGRLCALLVSHPPEMPHHPPLSVSFTAAVFHLPTLGITARQSDFSDKTSHRFFIRTITPYSQEANVFIALIHRFEWKQVNVIYTNDHEGRTMLSLLQRPHPEKRFQVTPFYKLFAPSKPTRINNVNEEKYEKNRGTKHRMHV